MTRQTGVLDIVGPGHRLGRVLRTEQWYCCSMVRAVCLELAGRTPRSVSYDGYAGVDPDWPEANAWKGYSPWGAVDAARALFGGDVCGPVEITTIAPDLPCGVWVVWQRWRGTSGHTQLLRREPDGTVTVVESDVGNGLRIHRGGAWSGDAGLAGYHVAYATLPGVP